MESEAQPTDRFRAVNGSPASLRISIVGSGPAGCVLALLLCKFPCQIDLYDYRADPRERSGGRARSINLALSTRGITALQQAGVLENVVTRAVPMHGRCVHPTSGKLQFHPYGQSDQYLLSVSRVVLSNILLDACEAKDSIRIHFQKKCVDVNLQEPSLTVQPVDPNGKDAGDSIMINTDLIVGADGAFSRVRGAMSREDRFNFSQSYITAAYKELSMDPGDFPAEWLHVWPRHRFMLIALPNSGGSFTSTLFMDKSQFDDLSDHESVKTFFEANFPDALKVMPTLIDDYFKNPTPSLVTIRCSPYNYLGNAVLIGDAAHAVVPFYGQGCNAAFEDCRLLVQEIVEYGWDLKKALPCYSDKREIQTNALADLAIDHYEDMSSRSAKPLFVIKRRFEILANRLFPRSFLPLYSMISFSNIPYAEAVERAHVQERRIERTMKLLTVASVSAITLLTIRRWYHGP